MFKKNAKSKSAFRINQRYKHCKPTLESLEFRQLMASDIVLDWNNHLIETIRADTTLPGPTFASRNGAIMHLAVYDAVNAIAQTHSSYYTTIKGPAHASKEAAAATAAYVTLAALYPTQQSQIHAWWTKSLADIKDGPNEEAGKTLGRQVAQEILALRQNDGAFDNVPYVVNPAPGHWSPDPLNPAQRALGANWGNVKPFGIDDPNDYMVTPPSLTSTEYAAAYNEVKSLGAKNSTTRTADQKEIGIFWAYDRGGMGPPTHIYNQATQTIAKQRNNSMVDNARLFAMVNLAIADSGVTSWNTKFKHDLWRPITGIRSGDYDGNSLTVGDPTWEPLGAPGGGVVRDFTPPFPAFTSGHATFGEAAFRTIANFYGTDTISFRLNSDELPGVTRTYTSLSQASEENARSRIYLGIHWNFDDTLGRQQGKQIADFVCANFMKKLPAGNATISVQNDGGGHVTYVLPAGAANVALRRSGNELEVVNTSNGAVLLRRDLVDLNSIRFSSANNKARDLLSIDQAYGGAWSVRSGITYLGGAGQNDGVWFAGGEHTNDSMTLAGNGLNVPGIHVSLTNVTYVGLAGHGGNDHFGITGDQAGRRVDLRGWQGDDTYDISAKNLSVLLEQNQGTDVLVLANMPTAVSVNLSQHTRQKQSIGNGITMEISGDIENLVGTTWADRLSGNAAGNMIWGRGGNDLIYGLQGNDRLFGEDGDDILVGGEGNDELSGGNGHDLLVGGNGYDWLSGDGGENVLIGGRTSYDANDAALKSLLSEWTAPRSRATRIANLSNNKPARDRRNGNNFLTTVGKSPTVLNDNINDGIHGVSSVDWVITS